MREKPIGDGVFYVSYMEYLQDWFLNANFVSLQWYECSKSGIFEQSASTCRFSSIYNCYEYKNVFTEK